MKDRRARDLSTSVVLLKQAARACGRLGITLGMPEGELRSPYYALRGGIEHYLFPVTRVLELPHGIPLPSGVVAAAQAAEWLREETSPHDDDYVPEEMRELAERVARQLPVLEAIIADAIENGWDRVPDEPLPPTWGKGQAFRDLMSRSEELLAVAKKSRLGKLRVFGSVARGEEREGSDVDLLVDGSDAGLADLWSFEDEARTLLGRPVHVVREKGLVDSYRDRILGEAITIGED